MPIYDTIVIKDGLIKGELAHGRVVTIQNKEWAKVNEDTVEGNWERITRTVVKKIIDAHSTETPDSVEMFLVDHDRFVDALINSSIIKHDDPETERQRAELLLEHLIGEGVYKRREQEVVVLDDLEDLFDEFSKLNWAAYFSYVVKEIDSILQYIENKNAEIIEHIEKKMRGGPETGTDLPSERELLEDLKQITGSCMEPVGVDENGYPVPPEGVATENEWKYKRIWTNLEVLQNFKRGNADVQIRIGRWVATNIKIIKYIASRITEVEQQLREASKKNVDNITEIREETQEIQEFVDTVLAGKTEKRNVEVALEAMKASRQLTDDDDMFGSDSQQ